MSSKEAVKSNSSNHGIATKPNNGLTADQLRTVVSVLSTALADEYVLRTKLYNYHWNITGPQFIALHELFEQQYTDLAPIIDDIAEQIRQNGGMAPGTLHAFLDATRLDENQDFSFTAENMVKDLVDAHETIVRAFREDVDEVGEFDPATEDTLIVLIKEHQKMAWLLRSFLEGESI